MKKLTQSEIENLLSDELWYLKGLEKEIAETENDWRIFGKGNQIEKVNKRIDLLNFIIENNIPVYESKIMGYVVVALPRKFNPNQLQFCNVALKGNFQYNQKGKWYRYSIPKLKEVLLQGV